MERTTSRIKHRLSAQVVVPILENRRFQLGFECGLRPRLRTGPSKIKCRKLLIVTVFTFGVERTTSRIKHRLSAQLVVPILEKRRFQLGLECGRRPRLRTGPSKIKCR